MRYGILAAAAAACLMSAGAASAQTMEEAAHCRSLTNVVIPDLEESLVQLKPPTVTQQSVDEIRELLRVMQALRVESQAFLDAYPRTELSEEEVEFFLMGGNVILGARNPESIRGWIGQCRMLFGL